MTSSKDPPGIQNQPSYGERGGAVESMSLAGLNSFEYSVLPSHAPEVVVQNAIYVRAPGKIEAVVEAERRRGFQGLVRRRLLYGCQRAHCDIPTCYTFRKTLGRTTNASRRLTVLSARIIACHLATGVDDPFRALCPGKPVFAVISSSNSATSSSSSMEGSTRSSSFREEIPEDEEEDEEKENRRQTRRRKSQKADKAEVEAISDKGLKDPKSFPQQLFSTVACKMVEWIGLPPPSGVFKFTPEAATPPAGARKERESEKETGSPVAVGKKEREDAQGTGTGLKHDIITHPLPLPPARKRNSSDPRKNLRDVTTTPHASAAKAKLVTPVGQWDRLASGPPPIGGHHHDRGTKRNVLQVTPSKGSLDTTGISTMGNVGTGGGGEGYILPPQSLGILDSRLVDALVDMCQDSAATVAERKDAEGFARQSLFYVFGTAEAAGRSFVKEGAEGGLDLDAEDVDAALRKLFVGPAWEGLVVRSLWMGLEAVFSKPGEGLDAKQAARIIILALHTLAAGLPKATAKEWEAVRRVRSQGKVSEIGLDTDISFEDEMKERLMRRIVKAVGYRSCVEGEGEGTVVDRVKGYFRACGRKVEEERRKGMEIIEDTVVKGGERGGWSLPVCTLEWSRSVLLRVWDGAENVKRTSVAAGCFGVLRLLYEEHQLYGLEKQFFCTSTLSDRLDPKDVPVEWFQSAPDPKIVHFLDHPFLFPPHALITYFRAINLNHMSKAYEQSMTTTRLCSQMVMSAMLSESQDQLLRRRMRTAINPYLLIEVRRETILEDAMNQVFKRERRELRRPLKVRFVNEGEEGVDSGGVQQEFFIFAMREAMKVDWGMWVTEEGKSWFRIGATERKWKYELVGLLVGLAIYNGVTLPVSFPKAMYMKLLDIEPKRIEDIEEDWRALGKGLRELERWSDGDVGDVFCRTYEFSYEFWGEVRNVDMIRARKNGEEFEDSLVEPPAVKKKSIESGTSAAQGQNWLGVEAFRPDPFMGGLDALMLEEMNRSAMERGRGYQLSLTEWVAADEAEGAGHDKSSEKGEEEQNEPEQEEQHGEEGNAELVESQEDQVEDLNIEVKNEETNEEKSNENNEEAVLEPTTSSEKGKEPASPPSPMPEPKPEPEEAPLVTNENRTAFIEDYIRYLTTVSVAPQYAAFTKGFYSIIDRKSLSLFAPSSLQSIVEGIQQIDVNELEKTARYDDGYHPNHRVIKDFWSVVRGWGSERRRQLLMFVTATDRVPVGGLGRITFVIQRNGPDSDRVPTSLTCFGRLLLPEYSSKKKLKEKLKLALENGGRGFGVP
ncbi:hypothetical protein RUND412_007945 [Rhizina undulata]